MRINKIISAKRKRQCEKLIDISKTVVAEALDKFNPEQLGVTWTGGKDSGLGLWIIKQVCEERKLPIPKTLLIGEGDEFQEIDASSVKFRVRALAVRCLLHRLSITS